jgi:hypothetical protein
VKSWFGDHEAARRRRLDETRSERERSWTERDRNPVERSWDRTRETVSRHDGPRPRRPPRPLRME